MIFITNRTLLRTCDSRSAQVNVPDIDVSNVTSTMRRSSCRRLYTLMLFSIEDRCSLSLLVKLKRMSAYKFWILLVLIVLVLGVVIYNFGIDILDQIKRLLGLSNLANLYNLYGYQYIDQTASLGTVIETFENVESALVCSNYAAMTPGCVGANYSSITGTCVCVSDLLPLSQNSDYQLLTLSANKLTNKVSAFTPTQSRSSKGTLYCSDALAYRPNAAALCANIPTCSGYVMTYSGSDNRPSGCLVTDSSQARITLTDTKSTLYTGPRTDGVLYNDTVANTNGGPFYRWGTDVVASNALQTVMGTTLDECANIARPFIGATGAVWDASASGTCTIYNKASGSSFPIQNNRQKTLILWQNDAIKNLSSYSNSFSTRNNIDYPTATVILTGLEDSNEYTLDDALLACANASAPCNCIIRNTAMNSFVFKFVGVNDLPSDTNNVVAYVASTPFV